MTTVCTFLAFVTEEADEHRAFLHKDSLLGTPILGALFPLVLQISPPALPRDALGVVDYCRVAAQSGHRATPPIAIGTGLERKPRPTQTTTTMQ